MGERLGVVNCVSAITSLQALRLKHSSNVLFASVNTEIRSQAVPIKPPINLKSFLNHPFKLDLSLEYIAALIFAEMC